jgi:hypothetical protein
MPFCRGKTAGAARLKKFIVRLLIVTYDIFVNLRTEARGMMASPRFKRSLKFVCKMEDEISKKCGHERVDQEFRSVHNFTNCTNNPRLGQVID